MLVLTVKRLNYFMKAIEIEINVKKYRFCTPYRIGILGEPNHASIINTTKKNYNTRKKRTRYCKY